MSHALITEEFADGTYPFCLTLDQWEELQEKVNLGPEQFFWRIARREYRAGDLRLVIRLALVGAGMNAIEARKKVERYVDNRPFAESWALALRIVQAAVWTPEEESAKKNESEKTENQSPDFSTLESSTATVQ